MKWKQFHVMHCVIWFQITQIFEFVCNLAQCCFLGCHKQSMPRVVLKYCFYLKQPQIKRPIFLTQSIIYIFLINEFMSQSVFDVFRTKQYSTLMSTNYLVTHLFSVAVHGEILILITVSQLMQPNLYLT